MAALNEDPFQRILDTVAANSPKETANVSAMIVISDKALKLYGHLIEKVLQFGQWNEQLIIQDNVLKNVLQKPS